MLQRWLWRRGRRALSAVVGISDDVRSQLEADGVAVRDVIWPGSPPARARPPLTDPPTVTYAGRLVREKGVDVLIRAFGKVRQRCPHARLVVAGTGPEASALNGLVAELGLADAIDLTGQLGNEQLDEMFNRGWVHAVPSRWPEPFGLTATEAMMRGTAVVASDLGGLAHSVEHEVTGVKVAPGDEAALANALMRLLADRPLAERLGAAGRRRALQHFSIDRYVANFETLYDDLVHPAVGRRL
jgi:glycosyltransferase involved in cell wall biosynthesis